MKTLYSPSLGLFAAAVFVNQLLLAPGYAWLPGPASPGAVDGFTVDTSSRRDVLAFHNCVFAASEGYAARVAYTGNISTCTPGATAAAFKEDVRRRVNYYRALSGLPADITFNAVNSSKCQEAALMMSANSALSHAPPSDWFCYTANGFAGAAASNLALGNYGPGAIDAYLRDDGANNLAVGHRRWLLYTRAREMGTGDVPPVSTSYSANATWVIGNFKPAAAAAFVAWPHAGFIPAPLVPARWSLSYPGATFNAASVTMTINGSPVATSVVSNNALNMGDNTLVWEPAGLPALVTGDVSCVVNVTGIGGGGPAARNYTVTIFNPDVLGESVTIAGTSTPSMTGQTYSFNSIAQADAYQVEVSSSSAAAWSESAEDVTAAQVVDQTTGGYVLRHTLPTTGSLRARTGAKAFHLAFPDFADQSFVLARAIIPTAASQLLWYDRGRFATTTNTLVTEVSNDDGATWTQVASRNGVGLSSGLWDGAWVTRSVSLAAFAGQTIRVRFVLRQNGGSISIGTGESHGFFVEDISISNATHLLSPITTNLAAAAGTFVLNAASAGAPLTAGSQYLMRMRPSVGCRWFGYGAVKTVTAQAAASGYAGWIAAQYPAVTGGFTADHDRDGISNGVEYAFNLNPTASSNYSLLPQPLLAGGALSVSYTVSAGVSGISYEAEWSDNLVVWNPLTNTGTGAVRSFSVSTAGKTRVWMRQVIRSVP
jgi:uncharacterized protein YkwD